MRKIYSAPCQKWAKRDGFVAVSKTLAGVGHLKRICKDAFRVAGVNTGDMFTRDVERQIFRFAKMILRDRCSTSYDLASLFRGGRSTLNRWNGKIAKRIGTRPHLCSQFSIFEGSLAQLLRFWCRQLGKLRKSRRIAAFFVLPRSKIEEA